MKDLRVAASGTRVRVVIATHRHIQAGPSAPGVDAMASWPEDVRAAVEAGRITFNRGARIVAGRAA